ncbi:MAG: chromosome segregation protein SMC [Cycloclasticus sp.]|nr:MAG: chromosome segregation protein SMC [Cycloclasticus sp.]
MRLEKIKLAGFKSFVDPTTIPFTSNMMGIVGPNGCGKSNVIDAVRWVMGESSAKHLRGDQMADVIFNGSTTRKPVGQAFVELFFDNSDATITGEYAGYQEISLKRQINREGQSVYFLNGTRCRRKDITDLFLGTGLGARSYAIIEQGTISRLVEAKPDELRVFLEEAAGISKYKERRRDTENRIRRTRENLDRIADLCEEIEKQCRHLKRQAGTAERYKVLRAEERQLKAQWLALRWQVLNEEDEGRNQKQQTLQLKVDEALAKQRELEKNIEQHRDHYNGQRETLNEVQAEFYSIGAEISRAEQALQHHQSQKEQQSTELTHYRNILQSSQQELQEGESKSEKSSELLKASEQALIEAKQQEDGVVNSLTTTEQAMHDWQEAWDEFTLQIAEPKRKIDVEKTKIDQLDRQLMLSTQRLSTAKSEQVTLNQLLKNNDLAELQQQYKTLNNQHEADRELLKSVRRKVSNYQQSVHEDIESLAGLRSRHARLEGRLESINVLQQTNLGDSREKVSDWLTQMGLHEAATLVEKINVASGWERAVEIVLGARLQAICVDDVDRVLSRVEQFPEGELILFNAGGSAVNDKVSDTSLANHVATDFSSVSILKNVHFATSIKQARQLLSTLAEHESVITQDGVWLHSDSVSFKHNDENDSVLVLAKEKKELLKTLQELSADISQKKQALTVARVALTDSEKQADKVSQQESILLAQMSELGIQLNDKQLKIEQAEQRLTQIIADISQCESDNKQETDSLVECKELLSQALNQAAQIEIKRESLQQQRTAKKELLEGARRAAHSTRELTHSLMLKIESHRSSQALVTQNIQTVKERIVLANGKVKEIQAYIDKSNEPLDSQKNALEISLKKHVAIEEQLVKARSAAEVTDQLIREFEAKRHLAEQDVQGARENISSAKIDHQEVLVRKQTLVEQMQETGVELDEMLVNLPAEAEEGVWQQNVVKLGEKINRLGPINLMAIEEYETQSERKQYLDSQQFDLTEALKTLESAIDKIDKESRLLFKQTFDKVNEGFEKRFPKLFGGGHAYLQQMGDDVLESGVTVMARPPGKRNSSIHLLSGGEKALTAVALVFSIFDLNPSPFCMLDEVDAPLDEANVGRFGELVREMSKSVQIILITHNKATMEMTNQLAGVTMKEPGVSRVVTVNLEEAAEMAAS